MRTIDADSLYDFLTEQLDKETGAYSKGRNAGINIARSALHDKTITQTITPPSNDPLTLEELREMDGEPVWVESFIRGLASHWAIVHGKYLSDGRFSDDMERCLLSADKNSGYGIAWIVYRRKKDS